MRVFAEVKQTKVKRGNMQSQHSQKLLMKYRRRGVNGKQGQYLVWNTKIHKKSSNIAEILSLLHTDVDCKYEVVVLHDQIEL